VSEAPLLFLDDTTPVQADADQPSTIFRGVACIRARHISMARRVYNTDCARSTWLSEPGDNVSGAGDGSRHGDQFSSEPIRLSTRPSIGPGVEAANGEFTLLGLLLPKGQRNQLKDLQREHRRIIQIEGTFYSGRS